MSKSLLKIVAVLFAAVALGATAAPTRGLAHGASSSVGQGADQPAGVGGPSAPAGVAGHSGSPSAPGKGAPAKVGRAPPGDPPSSSWKQQLGHRYQGEGGLGVVKQTCNPAYYDCGY